MSVNQSCRLAVPNATFNPKPTQSQPSHGLVQTEANPAKYYKAAKVPTGIMCSNYSLTRRASTSISGGLIPVKTRSNEKTATIEHIRERFIDYVQI